VYREFFSSIIMTIEIITEVTCEVTSIFRWYCGWVTTEKNKNHENSQINRYATDLYLFVRVFQILLYETRSKIIDLDVMLANKNYFKNTLPYSHFFYKYDGCIKFHTRPKKKKTNQLWYNFYSPCRYFSYKIIVTKYIYQVFIFRGFLSNISH